jgi:hypothetical protein
MTFGPAFDAELDEERLVDQMGRIRDLMLRDGNWRTLDEIAALTLDPPASISAQLRHLRKPKFGSHIVERRRRGEGRAGLWEYRVLLPTAEEASLARVVRKTGFLAGLAYAARVVLKAKDLADAKARLKHEILKAAGR